MRFLHTSDWQMGMRRHFLNEHNQAVFSQSRFDAVRRLMRLAQEQDCKFIVVAGDIFESNQVDPVTVSRTMEALRESSVPIFLLPANHDPLDAASVYRCAQFTASKPPHVSILMPGEIYHISDGVEVVGAPWTAKRVTRNPVASLVESLEPTNGSVYRVVVAHGAADSLSPAPDLSVVPVELCAQAIADKKLHYLALGDRHSTTKLHERIWFSGSPEPTDYDEDAPGNVLLVDLTPGGCQVQEQHIAMWKFLRLQLDLPIDSAIDVVKSAFQDIPDKSHTIVRCTLRGTVSLQQAIAIDTFINQERNLFGAIERPEHHDALSILPTDADFRDMEVSGFVKQVLDQLIAEIQSSDEKAAATAKGALALLYRLAEGASV